MAHMARCLNIYLPTHCQSRQSSDVKKLGFRDKHSEYFLNRAYLDLKSETVIGSDIRHVPKADTSHVDCLARADLIW